MIYWIKKISRLVALTVFAVLFFTGISYDDPYNLSIGILAFLKAALGGVFFWIAGFVFSDIVFKGVIDDIPVEKLDPLEGGLINVIKNEKERRVFEEKIVTPVKDEKPKKKK